MVFYIMSRRICNQHLLTLNRATKKEAARLRVKHAVLMDVSRRGLRIVACNVMLNMILIIILIYYFNNETLYINSENLSQTCLNPCRWTAIVMILFVFPTRKMFVIQKIVLNLIWYTIINLNLRNSNML